MVTTNRLAPPTHLSDADLLAEVSRLAARKRDATVALIAHLAELDARRLYRAEGCASLFTYCTQVLHLSEHAAYRRIEAARAARRFPVVLERLAEGSVTLTTVTLLAPHLTAENHRDLLEQARHRSRREVEELVVALRPHPPVPASVHRLPAPQPAPVSPPPRAEAPLRSAPAPPTPGSRHVPAAVKRAVWARDGGRCAFVSPKGAGARSAGASSSTTCGPTLRAGRRRWRTSNCAVGHTTPTKPSRSSAPGARRWCGSR